MTVYPGINAYGIDSLATDQYWQQYLAAQASMQSTPKTMGLFNADSTGLATGANGITGSSSTATTQGISTPTFQGAIPRAEETKKSALPAAALLIGTAAIGTGCWIASRGKATGAKGIGKQLKAGLQTFSKSSKYKGFSFTTINGKKVCTLPKQSNKIAGAGAADELAKIGFDNGNTVPTIIKNLEDGSQALADGIKIRQASFINGTDEFVIKNGKLVSYKNAAGENLMSKYLNPVEEGDKAYKEIIDKMIAEFNQGKNLDQLRILDFVHQQDGVLRHFSQNAGGNYDLVSALSHRFNIKDKAVDAYRLNDTYIDDLLKKFEKGKTDIGRITAAEYAVKMGGEDYTFVIENGAIKHIKNKEGKVISQVAEDSLKYHNSKVFENVFKNTDDFTNVIYAAA